MSSNVIADEIDEAKERAHFRAVVTAFKYYKLCSLDRIQKSEKIIAKLPSTHQRRLEKYKSYLSKFKKCLDVNNSVVHLIIKDVDTMFENVDHTTTDNGTNGTESFGCNYNNCEISSHKQHKMQHDVDKDVDTMFENVDHTTTDNGTNCEYNNCEISSHKQHKMQHDVDKVVSVLKNIVRDWSALGAAERDQCYKPILDEMEERFPLDEYSERSRIKVLVPGAGLGRLAWEVAARGYSCQGNEFSLFMLFASNFILNRCHEANKHTVHPWLHQYVNNVTCEHQLQGVTFPDVRPGGDKHNQNFSMTAGDFLKVYTEAEQWNCVASCFFIDCAPNVIEFIERIYAILEPGGFWINLGPLLYHYSDMPSESSIEPPYDILLDIIRDIGFDILYTEIIEFAASEERLRAEEGYYLSLGSLNPHKEQTGIKTKYAQNPNSMMQHEYDSVFFVCRKPYCM